MKADKRRGERERGRWGLVVSGRVALEAETKTRPVWDWYICRSLGVVCGGGVHRPGIDGVSGSYALDRIPILRSFTALQPLQKEVKAQ